MVFRYFKSSPEIIRLAVMLYVRYPLSLAENEDLPHKRGIAITHCEKTAPTVQGRR